MMREFNQIKRIRSEIGYRYITIEMTQSRIDKGLIAIPRRLISYFPNRDFDISIYLDNSRILQPKKYSHYLGSTRESRIGGMKDWFDKRSIESGDLIVIQIIDKDNFIYRIFTERSFVSSVNNLQNKLDMSKNEREVMKCVSNISNLVQADEEEIFLREFKRLVDMMPIQERKYYKKYYRKSRKEVKDPIRTILGGVYKGHCQICDFWFLKKDENPYFETHHIDRDKGDHPSNVLVVCGNCHNQFHYSEVDHVFQDDWLVSVSFNKNIHSIKHVSVDKIKDAYKEIFI